MARKKTKCDKVQMRLTKDRQGYYAFAYDISFQGKLIDTIIFSDCSHKKASEKIAVLLDKRFEI
jgi:hypothetical protein